MKRTLAGKLTAAGVPYTGDPDTDWWLDNCPDILERIRRHEAGETKTIPLTEVAREMRLKLNLPPLLRKRRARRLREGVRVWTSTRRGAPRGEKPG